MTSTTVVLLTLVTYKIILLAIGFWASRRVKTETDFFLAGQGGNQPIRDTIDSGFGMGAFRVYRFGLFSRISRALVGAGNFFRIFADMAGLGAAP